MFKVFLLNDDHTPMEFVARLLENVFEKTPEEAMQIMLVTHEHGRGVCGLYRLEDALKRVEQVVELASKYQWPLACGMAPISQYTTQFVTVEKDIKLEVLDWGGTGQSLIFLAGLGNDAHVFGNLAPKATLNHHVYSITRRGFGASSKPAPDDNNYATDRLGDDILAVMEALALERPVLVGHSFAGLELSSIGSRYPEKVAGLIYLDAWAPYDHAQGNIVLDMLDLKKLLERWHSSPLKLNEEIVEALLSSFVQIEKQLIKMKDLFQRVGHLPEPPALPPVSTAMIQGVQKYTNIPVPVLAIYADPINLDVFMETSGLKDNPAAKAAYEAHMLAGSTAITNGIETNFPAARVVRLPNADHYIFNSNEADVLREINVFLAELS